MRTNCGRTNCEESIVLLNFQEFAQSTILNQIKYSRWPVKTSLNGPHYKKTGSYENKV